MSNKRLRIFYVFSASQLTIFALSFFYYGKISLVPYINFSFYISSAFLFISLLVITVNSGFFDAMSYSFRAVFSSLEEDGRKKEIHEMTPLSEMVTISPNPILAVGLLDLILMLAGLGFYYF